MSLVPPLLQGEMFDVVMLVTAQVSKAAVAAFSPVVVGSAGTCRAKSAPIDRNTPMRSNSLHAMLALAGKLRMKERNASFMVQEFYSWASPYQGSMKSPTLVYE
jgi:hypothetical protein